MNNFVYTFYTDNGIFKRTHKEYLEDDELLAFVRNPENYKLYLGLKVMAFSPDKLAEDDLVRDTFMSYKKMQAENPLRFYAPNSQEQLDFINNDDATIYGLVDPNRTGKTSSAYIKALIRTIPCDPNWEIFKEHGVKYHKWKGPMSGALASYNQAKLDDPLWKEMVKKWTPDRELGTFGRTYKGKNKRFGPSFGHDKMVNLKCGSTLSFFTYEMDQGNYEGGAYDWWLWDEQGKKAMFDGADRGTRTTGGFHLFSLTPHIVEGRPDTGANGWVCPVLTGQQSMGHEIRVFHGGTIHDVPDWIYPQRAKEIEIYKWETEPLQNDDQKALAEGRARLYGEWHKSGGRVLDEWDERYCWTKPLWEYPPEGLTLYRSIDHGLNNANTVCLWWAVDENMNIYIYREYYSRGKQITQDVEQMVSLSGNVRKLVDAGRDLGGIVMPLYEEVFVREGIVRTALDGRSFKYPEKMTGKTYGWLYQQAGLKNLVPASYQFKEHWIPMLNEYFLNSRKIAQGKIPETEPCIYVFNTCTNLKREIEAWGWKKPPRGSDQVTTDTPEDKNDDGPTAMGYGVQIPLRFLGDLFSKKKKPIQRDPNDYWADPMKKKNKHTKPYYRGI